MIEISAREEDQRSADAKLLLLEIARCPVAKEHCDDPTLNGPCSEIVSVQRASLWQDFQSPEPWSGDIVNAPILFLSSNPSIDLAEAIPSEAATDLEIADFFENRFAGNWVRDGLRPRLKDGSYGTAVKYWSHIRGRASELLNNPEPGVDFVLSEIVHCKSQKEKGVGSALPLCTQRYLERLLSCSGASIIVLVGRKTLNLWNALPLNLPKVPDRDGSDLQLVAGRERYCLFLPHPAGFERGKRFSERMALPKLDMIRTLLLNQRKTDAHSRPD